MFAIRHPAVHTLWFDFTECAWTFDTAKRTTFGIKAEADDWSTLPFDGGIATPIN